MRPLYLFLILLVVLVWGINFVVIHEGLQEISPLFLCFSRFFLTSIPAIFFIKRPSAPFKMIASYGLVIFALQFALLFMGMRAGVAPGLASLLVQTQVFFTILLAVIFLGEKLHLWQVIGALVSFSGIGIVGINLGGSVTLLGITLVIASAASWGFGNLISKKIGKVNMFALVIWGSLMAWPPLLLTSLIVDGPERILYSLQHLSWISTGSILYISYFSTLFGFGIWSLLLHHYPLPTVAPFTLLVPIVAIASSVTLLGEPLQGWKITAGVLVIAGLCINLLGSRFFLKKH